MTSYIFNNKSKNITTIIFSVLILISPLYEIAAYICKYKAFPFFNVLGILPYVLILIYLLTLAKEYQFKKFLFPVAFSYLAVKSLYVIVILFVDYFYSRITFEYVLGSGALDTVIFLGSTLCVVGSLDSFKRPLFFRIGSFIIMVTQLFLPLVAFILVGGFKYLASVPHGYQAVSYIELLNCLVRVLYFFSLFSLTLNKKA